MIYLDLFLGFFRVGLFSFGGAYGAIPLIREVVLSYGWIDDSILADMIAVSESTPGPIMLNLATYVGASQAGIPGALIASVTVVLPTFIVTLLIMVLLKNAVKNKAVQALLDGLKPCITGIILATGLYLIFENCFGGRGAVSPDLVSIIMTAAFALIYFGSRKIKALKRGISPILLIAISAVAGIVVFGIK